MIIADSLDPRDEEVERNLKLVEELKIIEVKLFSESTLGLVRVEKDLLNEFKQELIKLLKYHDHFAWTMANMP